uniref:Dihydroorotase n=1 Tax=Klebsiella pneumoniae TaxID=573 RepID=A0A8B0SRC6_KLEPN|nr:Dihydroorotase [Klebsiella pneumoniae]
MKPLLLTNALIISEDMRYQADILIDKGRIQKNCLVYSLPTGMAGY